MLKKPEFQPAAPAFSTQRGCLRGSLESGESPYRSRLCRQARLLSALGSSPGNVPILSVFSALPQSKVWKAPFPALPVVSRPSGASLPRLITTINIEKGCGGCSPLAGGIFHKEHPSGQHFCPAAKIAVPFRQRVIGDVFQTAFKHDLKITSTLVLGTVKEF